MGTIGHLVHQLWGYELLRYAGWVGSLLNFRLTSALPRRGVFFLVVEALTNQKWIVETPKIRASELSTLNLEQRELVLSCFA